ncbi:MAG: hypothetical protein LBM77_12560 [Spirochaetaceae bacterium]|jgi:hypothetical protein|nr:hypothetical protein [Spirochaetaceae bacterium]
MKKFLSFVVVTGIILSLAACNNASLVVMGSITGSAMYAGAASDENGGITITVEGNNGLVSQSVLRAAAGDAFVNTIRASSTTASDGTYIIEGLAEGIYTIYAYGPATRERAMMTNIIVSLGETTTVDDITLATTGSLSGRIKLNGNEAGNSGLIVSLTGTNFMAITGDDGTFSIEDIPARETAYTLLVMKGMWTVLWNADDEGGEADRTAIVRPNADTALGNMSIASADIVAGNGGIVWKGSHATAPANPVVNWAYYNTTNAQAYIYDGSAWQVLAQDGRDGQDGKDGDKGDKGDKGDTGNTGADGKSAYQLWLEAGNSGTAEDFLASLVGNTGATGKSAYEIWKDAGNTGSEADFLEALIGATGSVGKSAYQIWLEAGNTGDTDAFLAALVGDTGSTGKSAYEIWIDAGNEGSEADFLEALVGETGDEGPQGAPGTNIIWKGSLETAPVNPDINWAYYNIIDGTSYIYDGDSWEILAQDGRAPTLVNILSIIPDGAADQTTTQITLIFDRDIPDLSVDDFSVREDINNETPLTGVTKGVLTKTAEATGEYVLTLTGITEDGKVIVAISKSGYLFSPMSSEVSVSFYVDVEDIPVAFQSATANGGARTSTTNKVTLQFDKDIPDFTLSDITVTGAEATNLTRTGTGKYDIQLYVAASGNASIGVSKLDYAFTPNSKTAAVWRVIPVTFDGVTANGDAKHTTSKLTLTFGQAITGLSANDISVSGGSKGALTSKGGGKYELAFTPSSGGSVTVTVGKDSYMIDGATKNVTTYKFNPPTDFTGRLAEFGVNTGSYNTARLDGNGSSTGSTADGGIVGNAINANTGPLGTKVKLGPREIFVGGVGNMSGGKYWGLYQDMKGGIGFTPVGVGNNNERLPNSERYNKTSVAADINGDGYDDVVTAVHVDHYNTVYIQYALSNGTSLGNFVDAAELSNSADGINFNDMESASDGYPRSSYFMSLVKGNFYGDSAEEIALFCGQYLYVYSGTGFSRIVNKQTYTRSWARGTTADYDMDGYDELFVLNSGGNQTGYWYVYDVSASGLSQKATGEATASYSGGSVTIGSGDCAAADFTGDGLPDTILMGKGTGDKWTSLWGIILETSMNASSQPTFSTITMSQGPGFGASPDEYINMLRVGNMIGNGKKQVLANNVLFEYNHASKRFDMVNPSVSMYSGGGNLSQFQQSTAMGDVTGDGLDDIVTCGWDDLEVTYMSNGVWGHSVTALGASSTMCQTLCLPNVDADGLTAVYTPSMKSLQFTNPTPITVLASTPYWDGVEYSGEGETTYGETTSGATSSEISGGFTASRSVGVEFSLFGSGMEAEATQSLSANWAFSRTEEWEETVSYSTPQGEDMVIFAVTPYDVYYYKILTSAHGSYPAGQYFKVTVPRQPRILSAELQYYNAVVGSGKAISLNHTVGNPRSYYSEASKNTLRSQYAAKGIFGNAAKTVGQGSGTVSISRTSSSSSDWSAGAETSIGATVKATVTGVSVGVGVELSAGYSSTNSIGSGTEISGTVANLPTNAYSVASNIFDWGIMAFPYTSNSQQFYLITYWTR